MSQPKEPEPVKLIASLFSAQAPLIPILIVEMEKVYGPTDWISPGLVFDRTKYYAKEMGWPLHRRFISFEKLVRPEDIVRTKLMTNRLENKYLKTGKREINIDPGYVSLERLVLATGKNYVHRIYLSDGIYADLTLIFKRGSFRPLDWTYKDYADPAIIAYFNDIRKTYYHQIKRLKNQSPSETRGEPNAP
jgi:hypothetical protein